MQMMVGYELIAYEEVSYFTLGDKKFVQVHLVLGDGEGEMQFKEFEVYTVEKWNKILKDKVVYHKENVGLNVIVGDYYN